MLPPTTIFYGAVINPRTLTSYDALPNCLIAVSLVGEIEWMEEDVIDTMVSEVLFRRNLADAEVTTLNHGEFIMPGFIDTHTHAPQYPNMGVGGELQLLDWLDNYTFPLESKFADRSFALSSYVSTVRRVISCGTTTCCYYGTLHLEATKLLARIVHDCGQRAFIGKCNMDRNCPDYYIEPSHEESLAATEALIEFIRSLPPPMDFFETATSPFTLDHTVQPILTPRFAISTSPELLTALGNLAKSDPTLHIQTHISENLNEVAFTKELFPNSKTYAGVYDDFGLLRNNTILAHAVHLEDAEMELIKDRNAGISHCPTSNFNLSSGVAKVGEYLDRGIKVGLGTDVSGGFATSILTAIQHASIASKVRSFNKNPNPPKSVHPVSFADKQLPIATLLFLATLGGAQVCCLDQKVGNFAAGKLFDALIVDIRKEAGNPALWSGMEEGESGSTRSRETLEGMLERFLFCGDDRNISKVYVQGRCIGGNQTSQSKRF